MLFISLILNNSIIYSIYYKIIHLKGSKTKIVFSNSDYYASKMTVNITIIGNILLCEVLVNYENETILEVLGSKIKEVELSEYLPIQFNGNTTRSQYCANLMNDGFSGRDEYKVSKNNVVDINCNDQNKSGKIEQLLHLYKPEFISSIVLWSHVDTSVISCNIDLYKNITILLHIATNTTEPCSEEVEASFTKANLLIIIANCSDSKNKIQSVSIRISNWTGGQITEIALYSKFILDENYLGYINNIDYLFCFNII